MFRKMVAVHGNVPSSALDELFMMASPFIRNDGKYADVIDILDNREARQLPAPVKKPAVRLFRCGSVRRSRSSFAIS